MLFYNTDEYYGMKKTLSSNKDFTAKSNYVAHTVRYQPLRLRLFTVFIIAPPEGIRETPKSVCGVPTTAVPAE